MKDKDTVFQCLRENQLLASELSCHWGEIAILNKRSKITDGYTFRCKGGREMGMRKFSFSQGSSYDIRDLILFVKCYLEGHSQPKSATFSNMNYKGTAVNWASYMQEMFWQCVYDEYEMLHFDEEVEIDESLFDHKIRYNHRWHPTGSPNTLVLWTT